MRALRSYYPDRRSLSRRLIKVTEPLKRLERPMRAVPGALKDALHATRAAVQEGVVVGGGVALVRASKKLRGVEGTNSDQTAGIAIVRKALQAPLRQIAENAGVDGSVVAGRITDFEDPAFGFNAQTEEYGDMYKFCVIDPAKWFAQHCRTPLRSPAS